MKIERKEILVKELLNGYVDNSETDPEGGVYAYGGKLCLRPAFQRSFVYTPEQENAVIDTILKGYPLNTMYWVDHDDGTYDCEDGQQRSLSSCHFFDGVKDFSAKWLDGGHKVTLSSLKRNHPDLYEKFMNYVLEVYFCKGTKAELNEWFKTINIAGTALTDQELRNVNYVGKWLTEAKRYFSKANPSSTPCPAERVGGRCTDKNANRQELLEQAIAWRVGVDIKDDEAICNYMDKHVEDNDASDLINYFNNIVEWVNNIFVEIKSDTKEAMKNINWGKLYAEYHNEDIDPDEVNQTLDKLLELYAMKALNTSIGKILEYCITKDDSLLSARSFNNNQKSVMYRKQNGICPECNKHFEQNEMHAHHKIPWFNGGLTEIDNGVMLCKHCHEKIHAETHFSI